MMSTSRTREAEHPERSAIPRPVELLAVDDDAVFLAGIARMLRGADCVVSPFAEPERALAHLAERAPSLIVVDLHMPRLDGLEFLRAAAATLDTSRTRCYLQSAVPPASEIAAEAERLGATVVDKRLVLQRAWLRAAVESCRTTPPGAPGH